MFREYEFIVNAEAVEFIFCGFFVIMAYRGDCRTAGISLEGKGDCTMKIFVVNCEYNCGQTLLDCAFRNEADAKAYADALQDDRAKAIARCRELITLRDGEEMVKFLDEKSGITFTVAGAELK